MVVTITDSYQHAENTRWFLVPGELEQCCDDGCIDLKDTAPEPTIRKFRIGGWNALKNVFVRMVDCTQTAGPTI